MITSAVLGGSNRVPPRAESTQDSHKTHGSWATAMTANPLARNSIPITIMGLAPKRSAIAPPKIPKPCCTNCLRPKAKPTITAAQPSWSTNRIEIRGKTTKNPRTTNMLSNKRKYLPRLLARDTCAMTHH